MGNVILCIHILFYIYVVQDDKYQYGRGQYIYLLSFEYTFHIPILYIDCILKYVFSINYLLFHNYAYKSSIFNPLDAVDGEENFDTVDLC